MGLLEVDEEFFSFDVISPASRFNFFFSSLEIRSVFCPLLFPQHLFPFELQGPKLVAKLLFTNLDIFTIIREPRFDTRRFENAMSTQILSTETQRKKIQKLKFVRLGYLKNGESTKKIVKMVSEFYRILNHRSKNIFNLFFEHTGSVRPSKLVNVMDQNCVPFFLNEVLKMYEEVHAIMGI